MKLRQPGKFDLIFPKRYLEFIKRKSSENLRYLCLVLISTSAFAMN